MAESKVIRPLGPYEQYSSSRHSMGLYTNVITVCRYALPPLAEGKLRAHVERAVAGVVGKLPALRVGIAGEDTKQPAFVTVPSLNLRDHVEWMAALENDDAALLRWVEQENVRPWPDVAVHPAWRVVVFGQTAVAGHAEVAFEVHHALADGLSGVVFHTHLLETLNERSDVTPVVADSILRFDDVPQLVPPQEEIVSFRLSWRFLLGTLWSTFGPGWLQPSTTTTPAFTGPPPIHKLQPGHLRLLDVPASTAASLVAACRAHGTTATPLLHALVLAHLARHGPAADAAVLSCQTPISLRPFVTGCAEQGIDVARNMANLVAAHALVLPDDVVAAVRAVKEKEEEGDAAIWSAAAAIGADLKARVDTIRQDNLSGLAPWVGDWHKWWSDQLGGPREATWEVSNLGCLRPNSDGPWQLTRCFYAHSLMGSTPLLGVHAASIQGGVLTLVFAWQDGALEPAFVDGLMQSLKSWTGRLSRASESRVSESLSESRVSESRASD